MLNFPPPPPPPIDASQLENLAEYYRSLVDYYRRASEIAAHQLVHVEALLHPNTELMFSSNQESWLSSPETHQANGNREIAIGEPIPQLSATAVIENGQKEKDLGRFDVLESNSQPTEEIEEENKEAVTEETLLEVLSSLLEFNRGKMLHLDYLVRKLYGGRDSTESESIKNKIRLLLEKGSAQQKWFAVPDAPDCWTINLGEFPDFTEPPTPPKRASSFNPRITLVNSERLDRYATVTDAIAACLSEHYPDSMSTKQIADWFYPEELSASRRQKVHAALSKSLSDGNNQSWRRVRVGKYIWKGS